MLLLPVMVLIIIYTSSSLGIKIYINGVLQTLTDNSNGGGIPDVPPGGETFSITPNKI